MAPRSKNANKHEAEMSERFPLYSEVEVDGKKGQVVGYAVNSKRLIVMVGGDRVKVQMPRQKKA